MPLDQNAHQPRADAAASPSNPLPQGYLWRTLVIICIFLGSSYCFIFGNSLIGAALAFAGIAFGKVSGLDAMLENHQRNTNVMKGRE
jgi:hypothetical protein